MKYLNKISQERSSESREFAAMGKRFDFDGPAMGTPSYGGEHAGYISAALKSGQTLANNWINVMDNVPFKAVLNTVTGANLIVDATCDFTDGGSVTLDERVLSVEEFQVNIDLCKKTLRSGYQAAQTGNSLNSRMPADFQDFVVSHIAGLVGQQVENNIWNGNTATSGNFTGFATDTVGLLAVDANVVDVDWLASADFTKANIIARMETLLDTVSSQVLADPEFGIYVSPKTAFIYQQALGASGYQLDYQANTKPSNIYGYPIYACPGMPDEKAVATYRRNLNFGSNILANTAEVNIIDRSPIDGSDNIRFVMRYSAGVQHGIAGDIYFAATTS